MTVIIDSGYAEQSFHGIRPCGDGWISFRCGHRLRLMLVDGMGHGNEANLLMEQLRQRFVWLCEHNSKLIHLSECMLKLHETLQHQKQTDQAAVALADIHTDTGLITVLSVGNVKVHNLIPGHCFSFPCMNGMVGGHLPQQLPVIEHQSEGRSLLALHSDGVSSRTLLPFLGKLISSNTYSHLKAQQIADIVIKSYAKNSDDASCIIVNINPGTPREPGNG